jgi:membrane protease YdiL (CAAX protease family)
MEEKSVAVSEEGQVYSVPWKAVDHWVGIFLLILIDLVFLAVAMQGGGVRLAQNAMLVLMEMAYLLPLVMIFAYRRIHPKALGFGKFNWSALGLGCALLPLTYFFVLIHNVIIYLLGIVPQGMGILKLFSELDSPFWFMLVGIFLAPVVEEIFFRGFLFQGFRQQYGWVKGALLSSLIFGAVHLDPAAFLPAALLGFLFAYMYHRTNSVWVPISLHMLVNALGLCAAYAATQLSEFMPM